MRLPILLLVGLAGAVRLPALTIRYIEDNSNGLITDEVRAGFAEAASLWEQVVARDVTVNIGISMGNLGAGTIGQTNAGLVRVGYANYRDLLTNSGLSHSAALPAGASVSYLLNNTTDAPGGSVSGKFTSSSTGVAVTRAQLKAIGFDTGAVVDANLQFNVAFDFDYDRSNGIAVGKMDFVGVAAHEIGHALGFVSFVDYVDTGIYDSRNILPTGMDLLRYSAESDALGIPDLSVGLDPKYLKIGGLQLGMSTGVENGNGYQAAHFLPGVGLMRPAVGLGKRIDLTAQDMLVFDALGWQLVPEPSTYAWGCGALLLGCAACRRLRRPPEPRQRGSDA